MSFLRHREIYPSDGDAGIVADVPSHRLDEFPVSYFSASCTPALLASASPTGSDYAVKLPCWSTVFQQPANSVLTGCLSPGGKRRAALALRLGAHSLCRAKDYFGEFFRRMRAKLGAAQATTATAHKLARVIYHVLRTKTPYNETVFHECDEQARQRTKNRL